MSASAVDDHSGNAAEVRAGWTAQTGGGYPRFVRELAPRWSRVWCDLALGYAALAVLVLLAGTGTWAVLPAAVGIGYGVAFLQLFLHEGAHHNLAPGRRANDALCDLLVSWQVGTTVARYRPVHFAHHRLLGTTRDTERSYFHALTPRLLIETLTGWHAVRVLATREGRTRDASAPSPVGPVVAGVTAHGAVLVLAWAASGWRGVAAWVLGVASLYPLFATVRQLAEHRSSAADPGTDYAVQPHGAVSRIFRAGPVGSTFGGAGFNRHLLHHWEPQVSYTRLADLERYLEGTSAAPLMAARRTTYGRALAALWRNDNRAHG